LRGEKSEARAASVTWKHPVEAVGCPWPHIEPKLLKLRPPLAQKLGGGELHDRKRHEPIFADPQRATAIGRTAWYLWDVLVRLRERHEYHGIGGITFAETRALQIDKRRPWRY
jgi:hypothetical protein